MELLEDLKWRYAAKRMNGKTVPQEYIDDIIEAAYLAPTSSGLQPFRIISVADKELKQEIFEKAVKQPQITEASHVLVFAAWDNYSAERINAVFEHSNRVRNLPASQTEAYQNRLIDMMAKRTAEENHQHAAKQAYIALGLAVAAAAHLRVDATPMEGFDGNSLDEVLKLPEMGLKSVVVLPLGYRDEENDWLVKMKKVRTPKEEFLIEL